jgi:hypothetical protein
MTPFKDAYDKVEKKIESRYGIPVSISDVLDPNTGDFDGMKILIDYDQDMETAFFVLVHLFGHTVQWNISEDYRKLGIDVTPGKTEQQLQSFYTYEKAATRYAIKLMHEAGVSDLDRWVSDWWHADWKYLEHFYRTGEKLDFKSLIRPGEGELLTEMNIPKFEPQKWVSRWSF